MASIEVHPYTPPQWAVHGLPATAVPSHRISLGLLPTPIHRWHVSGLPEGVELYIKRDDLTGMQLSGNKVRKLEFILAEAKAQGHDSVITLGGIQSNHARATAVAARYLGLDAHLILRTSRALVDQDPGLNGNLMVERLMGAHMHLVTKEEYTRLGQTALGSALMETLRRQGRNPYLIPVGGSSPLGTWGYIEMFRELLDQIESQGLQATDIVIACGSGGTTGGLALGNHLSGAGLRVTGYMVCDDEGYFTQYIDDLFIKMGFARNRLGSGVASMCRFVQAKGNGYALSRKEELETVAEVAAATGIITDPVYTGKALNGLLKELRTDGDAWKGRKIVFVHTGGLLGLFESAPQLQPLVESWGRVHRMAM